MPSILLMPACSWISQHPIRHRTHGVAFALHDVGLALFALGGLAHVLSPTGRGVHVYAGRLILSVACPVLVLSGFVLCAYHDRDDAVVFVAYGAVFATTWLRQLLTTHVLHGANPRAVLVREPSPAIRTYLDVAFSSTLRSLNGMLSVAALLHCAAGAQWRAWHADLCWTLVLLPWIAVRGPSARGLGTTKQAWRQHHRRTGRALWYLGVLGTVFSFTHDPYPVRSTLLRWTALTLPHALFLAAQK